MKKLLLSLGVLVAFVSCKQEPKDYATVSGKISDVDVPADSLYIFNETQTYKKAIKLNEDGTFSDTLKVKTGHYIFQVGQQYGNIYLQNNDELKINTNYQNFDNDLKFSGEGYGVAPSNMLADLMRFGEESFNEEIFTLDEEKFNDVVKKSKEQAKEIFSKHADVNDSIKNKLREDLDKMFVGIEAQYKQKQALQNKLIGKPAPNFTMKDINGKDVSLSDFKGKYVYVDIWATWCGPCKAEIPSLKKLEEKYHDKDIVFLSMSVDEPKDQATWENFVKEKDLKGVQVFTGKGWKADFVQDLEVQGIPRFVLIDKDGNILNPDAPRPSSEAISATFDDLVS